MMSTQCSKHVEAFNKRIIKQDFVHQVGQLLGLYLRVYNAEHGATRVLLF